jgi:hypothetical protein
VQELIWLASFPKSGSTWLRTALHGLFHGPLARSSDLGVSMPSLHGGDLHHARVAMEHGGIVLTHKAAGPHLERYPAGAGVILLVRHPADVLVSEARYFALTQLDGSLAAQGRSRPGPGDLDRLVSTFASVVLARGSTPERARQGVLGWGKNVESWLDHSRECPGLIVRYEDLKAALPQQLRRIAAFLGMSVDAAALERAGDVASLRSMRALQEHEIAHKIPGRYYEAHHEKAYAAGLRFVASGTVGQGLKLPAGALQALHQRWGPVAERLGYRFGGEGPAVGALPAELQSVRPLSGP